MLMKKRLACSFCRKSDRDVAKLVAGPGVYICDECVAIAGRLMQEDSNAPLNVRMDLSERFRDRLRALIGLNRETARCDNPL